MNVHDFDLNGMIQALDAMFSMRAAQEGLAWHCQTRVQHTSVHGDEGKLHQVLVNLLANAVKFPPSGSVTLLCTSQKHDTIRFEVIDTGPGIQSDRQAAIFEPFQQEQAGLEKGGTGLGLAISKRLVEMLGGELRLDSRPAAGARFYFELDLPAATTPVKPWVGDTGPRVLRLAPGVQVWALIVDDVESNRGVLAQLLADVGIDVVEAASGAEALERVAEHLPDIILSDIRMPGMTGTELLRRLQEKYRDRTPKTIAVTAAAFEHQRREFMDQGFCSFLSKPVRADLLYQCLGQELGIAWQYDAEEEAEAAAVRGDWRQERLPPELHARLVQAVENNSITQVRRAFDDMGELEEGRANLVAELRALAGRYDMPALRSVLDAVAPD